jgi:excisionase family DNA binding protein
VYVYANELQHNGHDPIAGEFDGAPGHRDAEAWVTTRRAALYLDCSPKRIRDLVRAGSVPAVRDGARLLVRLPAIDDYLGAR